MAKTSKKVLGTAMAGVMAVGAIAGAVNAVDQVKVAKAAESQAVKSAKAKISHLTKSLKTNYLGLKNQAQWEVYVKEARVLIAKIPTAEATIAAALTAEVNRDQELVNALARINKVEKSYETNFKGIKNAKQWREYLDLATTSLKAVDQSTFGNQYAELVNRMNVASDNVKKIEDAFKIELAEATKLLDAAKVSMNLDDAKKAVEAAAKLGTCTESDELKAKCSALVSVIQGGNVEVKTVAVAEKTYDDDTKDQKLTLLVNGEAMNIDFVKAAGYDVNFVQTDEPNAGNLLFKSAAKTSTDGKIADTTVTGDYEVQVTVSKKGAVVVSNKTKVVVKNLDNQASSISAYELTNNTTTTVMKSSTLVVGETADITEITVSNGSTTTDVTSGIEVESSNDAVVSVAANNKITANSPGTAKLTVTYGKVTKEIDVTVKSDKREVTKVTPKAASLSVATGKSVDLVVNAFDQYGDPVASAIVNTGTPAVNTGLLAESVNGLAAGNVIAALGTDTADKDGEATMKVTAGTDDGTDTVVLKNEDGNILTRVSITTVKNASVNSSKIEIIKTTNMSEDNTIDLADAKDNSVKFEVKNYNVNGVAVGTEDLTACTVKFDAKIVSIGALVSGAALGAPNKDAFTVAALDDGTTDIAIYDAAGVLIAKTSLTVVDTKIKVSSVNWSSNSIIGYAGEVINYEDVLSTVKEAGKDSIIKGINLSASTYDKVRIDTTNGRIYLDENADGAYTSETTDKSLGKLEAKVASGATGMTAALNFLTTGYTSVAKDKGTIVITLSDYKADAATTDKVISSTSITLDVK